MLEQERLGDDRASAAASHQLRDGCDQVNQKDGRVTHPDERNDQCQPGKTAKTSGSMR
jgi:hypothetical protein